MTFFQAVLLTNVKGTEYNIGTAAAVDCAKATSTLSLPGMQKAAL